MDKQEYDALAKRLYFPPAQPQILRCRRAISAVIDGQGDPNTSVAFQDAVAAVQRVVRHQMLPKRRCAPVFQYKVSALKGCGRCRGRGF